MDSVCMALDFAIRRNDVERVRGVLQHNQIDLHADANKGLLWTAVRKGNVEIIELMIRAGADVNAEDPEHKSVDNWSILQNFLHEMEPGTAYERLALLAIEHGANIHYLDDDGYDALSQPGASRSILVMKALLARGATLRDEDDIYEKLEMAYDSEEALPFIVGLFEPSIQLRSQRAALAIRYHLQGDTYSHRLFEKLLEMVVDVDKLVNGDTTLMHAVKAGRSDAVKAVLDRGAGINRKNAKGILPIYAASKLDNTDITKLLISRGASIHSRNKDGKYPIHGACASKTIKNVHFLLSQGASLNVTDKYGDYPLHIACSNKCLEIVNYLSSLVMPMST